MIRLLLVAGAVALGVLGPAACQGRASAQPVTGGALAEKTMQHDGRERRYLVHDFSGGKPAPVVFVLHGGGGHCHCRTYRCLFLPLVRTTTTNP